MSTTPNRNYPQPEIDNRVSDDLFLLRAALEMVDGDVHSLILALSGVAPKTHRHEISEINELTAALAGKAASDHAHRLEDLTDVEGSSAATPGSILYKGPNQQWIVGNPATVLGVHQHTVANIEGLQTELDGKLVSSSLPTTLLAYTTKATPVDADTMLGFDSTSTNQPKRFSWANIKTTLKSYFDGIYAAKDRAIPSPAGVESETTNVNTLITPGWHPLLVIGTQPNGWGTADYGYLYNAVYSNGASITQFVLPYYGGRMRYRSCYEGTWQKWEEVRIGKETVSSASPSGGADGDVWLQV